MLKRQELMENFQTKLVEIGLHISWPVYLANNKKNIYDLCMYNTTNEKGLFGKYLDGLR